MLVKCADCEDVQLVCSMSDKKNRFKLNKCKSRGSAEFKGGRPRKVVEVAEVETSQVKAEWAQFGVIFFGISQMKSVLKPDIETNNLKMESLTQTIEVAQPTELTLEEVDARLTYLTE